MESLITALTGPLLHPTVLVASAVATLLLFSGAVGWTFDVLARRFARRNSLIGPTVDVPRSAMVGG